MNTNTPIDYRKLVNDLEYTNPVDQCKFNTIQIGRFLKALIHKDTQHLSLVYRKDEACLPMTVVLLVLALFKSS